jgi:hypothetical protein
MILSVHNKSGPETPEIYFSENKDKILTVFTRGGSCVQFYLLASPKTNKKKKMKSRVRG